MVKAEVLLPTTYEKVRNKTLGAQDRAVSQVEKMTTSVQLCALHFKEPTTPSCRVPTLEHTAEQQAQLIVLGDRAESRSWEVSERPCKTEAVRRAGKSI